MKNWLYVIYAAAIAILSIFTGEIVTFVMLGFILVSLHNINANLKEILKTNKNNEEDQTK